MDLPQLELHLDKVFYLSFYLNFLSNTKYCLQNTTNLHLNHYQHQSELFFLITSIHLHNQIICKIFIFPKHRFSNNCKSEFEKHLQQLHKFKN